MNKLTKFIGRGVSALGNRGFFHNMKDEKYLKIIFPAFLGYKLDLENPKTFNEKLQWLKIHNRKDEFTTMVDKYAVRKYIEEKIGEEHLIPLIAGPFENADQIDFNALPDQFVLKCTHDSKSVIICKDKSSFDIKAACKKLNRHLKNNLYYGGREWPYKNVKPQIIAEKYMVDESGAELKDYKLYCFNGHAEMIQVIWNRTNTPKQNMYSTDWEYIPLGRKSFTSIPDADIEKPKSLKQMITFAEELSKGLPFLRVDFYSINGKIYFGELTFYPADGFSGFDPPEWDRKLGDLIDLSLVKED